MKTLLLLSWMLLFLIGPCACAAAGAADAGTGGVASGGMSSGGAGTGGVADRGRCGETICVSFNTCCLGDDADVCGLRLPQEVFAESCVPKEPREGVLDSSCPESRDYCPDFDGERCIFPGCRRADDVCGFWVEDYWVFDEIQAFSVLYADNLGCMAAEEFVP